MVVRKSAARSVKSGLVPLSDQPPGYNMWWTCEVPALPLAYVSGPRGGAEGGGACRGMSDGVFRRSRSVTQVYGSTLCVNTTVPLENRGFKNSQTHFLNFSTIDELKK